MNTPERVTGELCLETAISLQYRAQFMIMFYILTNTYNSKGNFIHARSSKLLSKTAFSTILIKIPSLQSP
jgi:hypothetical protein